MNDKSMMIVKKTNLELQLASIWDWDNEVFCGDFEVTLNLTLLRNRSLEYWNELVCVKSLGWLISEVSGSQASDNEMDFAVTLF
jgi:hypothetical protein